jgi:predicted NACHT family NTPase
MLGAPNAEQAAPKRERLRKAINDSKSIAMLAGNPLLLTMMAILNRNQELPRDRVDLYG